MNKRRTGPHMQQCARESRCGWCNATPLAPGGGKVRTHTPAKPDVQHAVSTAAAPMYWFPAKLASWSLLAVALLLGGSCTPMAPSMRMTMASHLVRLSCWPRSSTANRAVTTILSWYMTWYLQRQVGASTGTHQRRSRARTHLRMHELQLDRPCSCARATDRVARCRFC